MRKRKTRPVHRCACLACAEHPRGEMAQEHRAINRVLAGLDEKSRRQFAGLLALQRSEWGGLEQVHAITGLSRTTIRLGREEVRRGERTTEVRRSGGGRKAIEKSDLQFSVC